jgi:hypothetical protein
LLKLIIFQDLMIPNKLGSKQKKILQKKLMNKVD